LGGATPVTAAAARMGLILATALLGAAYLVLPWLWDNVVIVGRRLWATRNVPEPPGSLLLGHIPTLVGARFKSFRCFHAWSLQWPVFRVRFFARPVSHKQGCPDTVGVIQAAPSSSR
jgi:hypothetical protein